MADRAIDIFTNPEKAREIDQRGQERVERLFSRGKRVGQYEALYNTLAVSPAAP